MNFRFSFRIVDMRYTFIHIGGTTSTYVARYHPKPERSKSMGKCLWQLLLLYKHVVIKEMREFWANIVLPNIHIYTYIFPNSGNDFLVKHASTSSFLSAIPNTVAKLYGIFLIIASQIYFTYTQPACFAGAFNNVFSWLMKCKWKLFFGELRQTLLFCSISDAIERHFDNHDSRTNFGVMSV